MRGNGRIVPRGKWIEAAQDARLFSARRSLFLFYKLGVVLATAGCRGGVSPCNSLIEQVE